MFNTPAQYGSKLTKIKSDLPVELGLKFLGFGSEHFGDTLIKF
jgi:hypothetical protein